MTAHPDTPTLIKTLKKLVSEGYKLKAHHSNPAWRQALEEAETLLILLKTR